MENALRVWRGRRGLTQEELAERAGVSRQTISHLERDQGVPGVDLALRLAHLLSCTVEDLFGSDEVSSVVGGLELVGSHTPLRVVLGSVGGRKIARDMVGLGGYDWPLAAAHALARVPSSGPPEVRPLRPAPAAVFLAGCDPALGLLAGHVDRRRSLEGYWWHAANRDALTQLTRGEVHGAATHGDPETMPTFPGPALRVRLGRWQMGWMTRRGGLRIQTAADLARPGTVLANRPPGAGVRTLLDRVLAQAGVSPASVGGYHSAFRDHGAVAHAVACGAADVGLGPEVAARSAGLSFLPVAEECSDLWIPADVLETDEGTALAEALMAGSFKQELSAFGPYDTAATGSVVGAAGREEGDGQ